MSIDQTIQATIKTEVAKQMTDAVIDYDGIVAAIIKGVEKELPKQIIEFMRDDNDWIYDSGILETITEKFVERIKNMPW
jgi:ribosomal protein L11 methylase PrmA